MRRGRAWRRAAARCPAVESDPDHRIGPYRAGYVSKTLLTQIGELEWHSAANVIVGGGRQADAAGSGNIFELYGDVDLVSEDVMRLDDHVTDIDADAETNTLIFGITDCNFKDAGLEPRRSADRFDGTGKLGQEPVAGILDDMTAVLDDRRLDSVHQKRGQFGVGRLFVMVHEPGIPGHVGGQYRRQPAPNTLWPLLHHRIWISSDAHRTPDRTLLPTGFDG